MTPNVNPRGVLTAISGNARRAVSNANLQNDIQNQDPAPNDGVTAGIEDIENQDPNGPVYATIMMNHRNETNALNDAVIDMTIPTNANTNTYNRPARTAREQRDYEARHGSFVFLPDIKRRRTENLARIYPSRLFLDLWDSSRYLSARRSGLAYGITRSIEIFNATVPNPFESVWPQEPDMQPGTKTLGFVKSPHDANECVMLLFRRVQYAILDANIIGYAHMFKINKGRLTMVMSTLAASCELSVTLEMQLPIETEVQFRRRIGMVVYEPFGDYDL